MRFFSILIAVSVLATSGCASYRNRPAQPEPSNNYWYINAPAPGQDAQQENVPNG